MSFRLRKAVKLILAQNCPAAYHRILTSFPDFENIKLLRSSSPFQAVQAGA